MALEHILLGLLRTPGSGTDIKRAFDEAIGHFWAAELSQVYPTLKRMQREKWLTVSEQASDKGPPRKVYALTKAGRAELHAWLGGRPGVGTERLEWLAQTWFLSESPERALPFFHDLRAAFAAELAALEAIETYWRSQDPSYPEVAADEDFFPQLTLDLGLRKLRVKVEWCEACIERIAARQGALHSSAPPDK